MKISEEQDVILKVFATRFGASHVHCRFGVISKPSIGMLVTIKHLMQMGNLPAGREVDLSELVYETMAEEARANQWQRVFPCIQDPLRYLDKFEMQRTDTKHVCQALIDWHGNKSSSVQSQGAVQPSGRAWR